MPFYLTNENIEATMERNPDDIFNPSAINHKPSSRNTKIRQFIFKEIKNTFEKNTQKQILINGLFENVNFLIKDSYLAYLFTLETDNDEYEITYHISSSFSSTLKQFNQKNIDEEIFLNLSNSIVTCLNKEDFVFLQDIELVNLCKKIVDYEKIEIEKNFYSLNISIDKKEYVLYLELDKQFNKIF